jgi:hypothetical protein
MIQEPLILQQNEVSLGSRTDEVILLDGRIIETQMGQALGITDRNGKTVLMRFDNLARGNALHESIFAALKKTLSTHSVSYNSTMSYAINHWLETPGMSHKDQADIPELNFLHEIPLSYRGFAIPLLRRISSLDMPGLSEQVRDFLEHPFKWEEQGTGAYFGLITNDPERGALTEQEIHNINQQLNKAYSKNVITQAEYTLCWFFIGTGVRPVQVLRMNKDDVIIHSREGLEVTLRVPLAKGEMSSTQEVWNRRAPTVLAESLINYLDLYPPAK